VAEKVAKEPKVTLAIVIPVYNEEKVIRQVIEGLPKKIDGIDKISIIAVDDSSTDQTLREVSKTGATVLHHRANLGYGGAVLTGLRAAQRTNSDIVATFDGDGQHDPQDIARIVGPIIEGRAEIVIGSRTKARGMPVYKKIGNWGLNFITLVLSGKWSSDSQSGLRAFSKKSLPYLTNLSSGYEFCSEILIEAKRHRLDIQEVPVKAIYTRYSRSKGQNVLNAINIITKLIFKKITG